MIEQYSEPELQQLLVSYLSTNNVELFPATIEPSIQEPEFLTELAQCSFVASCGMVILLMAVTPFLGFQNQLKDCKDNPNQFETCSYN